MPVTLPFFTLSGTRCEGCHPRPGRFRPVGLFDTTTNRGRSHRVSPFRVGAVPRNHSHPPFHPGAPFPRCPFPLYPLRGDGSLATGSGYPLPGWGVGILSGTPPPSHPCRGGTPTGQPLSESPAVCNPLFFGWCSAIATPGGARPYAGLCQVSQSHRVTGQCPRRVSVPSPPGEWNRGSFAPPARRMEPGAGGGVSIPANGTGGGTRHPALPGWHHHDTPGGATGFFRWNR